MDVFLSDEALKALKAISMVQSPSCPDGILIGHIRGHRHFVERAMLTRPNFFLRRTDFLRINSHYDDGIVGFFSFRPETRKTRKILAPFACGRIYLEIGGGGPDELDIRSHIIEFDEVFHLSPIRLEYPKSKV